MASDKISTNPIEWIKHSKWADDDDFWAAVSMYVSQSMESMEEALDAMDDEVEGDVGKECAEAAKSHIIDMLNYLM